MPRAPTKTRRKQSPTSLKRIIALARSGERVIVRDNGRAAAALIPLADLRLLEAMEDQIDASEVNRIRATAKPGDFLPFSKLKVGRGR